MKLKTFDLVKKTVVIDARENILVQVHHIMPPTQIIDTQIGVNLFVRDSNAVYLQMSATEAVEMADKLLAHAKACTP